MQVIHRADSDILKLWGSANAVPATYRLLTYTIMADTDGGMLLHNSVTGETVLPDGHERESLSSLPCEYEPWMDEYIKRHFLVRAELDDKKTVDTLRRAWRIGDNPREITNYTILPTTACNARCFYCYESGCRHENMTDETADMLVRFIGAHHGSRPVRISWFGGEPLVGVRQIDRICGALKDSGIEFSSSMVSNGYLFDRETVARARDGWRLDTVQVTLDGTEKVYNETKAYVSPCENPYERVLENIAMLLLNGIHVNIRLNLGLHNADDLDALADELAARFRDKENLSVYPHILFEGCGFDPVHFGGNEAAMLIERRDALAGKLRLLSLGPSGERLPCLKKAHCMADSPDSVVVLPTGRLGKCEHFVDRNPVGNLEDGITDMNEINLYSERVTYPGCEKCPLYPSCIKLKRCEPDGICSDTAMRSEIKKAIRTIKSVYDNYLRSNVNAADSGEVRERGKDNDVNI